MMTRLEAVNEMLAAIGENPVSNLSSGLPEAESAQDVLDRVSKQTQAPGWYVNRETLDWSLDQNKEIILPATVLRIDTVEHDRSMAVKPKKHQNTRKLWRVKERSFKFDYAPRLKVHWFLPFEDLNYELQKFITIRSARLLQADDMSSAVLDDGLEEREQEALVALEDAEEQAEDLNVLRDNAYARRLVRQYHPHITT